jgi:hypothetical protein
VGVFGGGDMVAAGFQFDDEFFDEGGFTRFGPSDDRDDWGHLAPPLFFRNNGAGEL